MENNSCFLRKMNSAVKGNNITIGFIGGSITQGTGATEEENCYAYRVYKWWESNFSNSQTKYINAGIGGTDSKFGVARVSDDLLQYKPDIVVVEFAVNDVDNPDCLQTAEGLIRRILENDKETAVLILCNLIYDSAATMQDEYEKLAQHYDIPLISIKDTVYKKIQDGILKVEEVTTDKIHPIDKGHELIAKEVTDYLESVKKLVNCKEGQVRDALPSPITSNSYEDVIRYNSDNFNPLCEGFETDLSLQSDIRDCFKKGWFAKNMGDKIEFDILSRGFVIQYRRTVDGPAPKVRVCVDGIEVATLDGKFDQDWGDKLEIVTVSEYKEALMHKLTLTVYEAGEECVPFYLVSVIAKH